MQLFTHWSAADFKLIKSTRFKGKQLEKNVVGISQISAFLWDSRSLSLLTQPRFQTKCRVISIALEALWQIIWGKFPFYPIHYNNLPILLFTHWSAAGFKLIKSKHFKGKQLEKNVAGISQISAFLWESRPLSLFTQLRFQTRYRVISIALKALWQIIWGKFPFYPMCYNNLPMLFWRRYFNWKW